MHNAETQTDCALTEHEFRQFRDLIYKWTGIALTEAKRHLVQSRLQKRLRAHGLTRFQDYYNLVISQSKDSPEQTELINCITTNKTDFFREPHHFDFVANTVVPEMAERVAKGERRPQIRVWHAGCSTGEEPYTLAMTLAEALQTRKGWDAKQLASDIDTSVLAHAKRGVYECDRVAPVPTPLLHKYFLRGRGALSDCVRVRDELRERITFRQINLLDAQWPIREGTRFDMIFCRNVVIYFDKPTRQELFARYVRYLRPGGYLFIGHSESLLGVSNAFKACGPTVYRLPETSTREALAA